MTLTGTITHELSRTESIFLLLLFLLRNKEKGPKEGNEIVQSQLPEDLPSAGF